MTIKTIKSVLPMLLVLLFATGGLAQKYQPIDELLEARKLYREGRDSLKTSKIIRAANIYVGLRKAHEADPQLMSQYSAYYARAGYKLGWCYLRRVELDARLDLLDSVYYWFDSVPISASESVGVYAAYMAGECRLRQAVIGKFEKLSAGVLTSAAATDVRTLLSDSERKFGQVLTTLPDASPLRTYVRIRAQDAAYERAKLLAATDEQNKALAILNTINYADMERELTGDGSDEFSRMLAHSNASVLFQKYLIARDRQSQTSAEAVLSDFGSDTDFRAGNVAHAKALVASAEVLYDTAIAFYKSTIDDNGIDEAYYWLGFVHLIQSVNPQQLGQSRESFDSFLDAVGDDTLWNERLKPLARSAEHKRLTLDIALGGTVSAGTLQSLTREDLKFLIRVAASMTGSVRRTCLRTLDDFLDQQSILAPDEARFYQGMVLSLRAELKFGKARRNAFLEAAGVLSTVGGDYEGEGRYVQARSLALARLPDADSLYREVIQQYHSARALYGLAINFGQPENLSQEYLDTAYQILRVVRQTIEAAGTPIDYELFKINADAAIAEYGGFYPQPVDLSISGIDALVCPERLSVDRSGAQPEVIFYEALADRDFIRRRFAHESIEQLQLYGLPKKFVYPAVAIQRRKRSIFADRAFEDRDILIPDEIPIETTWRARLQFVDIQGTPLPVDGCEVTRIKDSMRLTCKDSTDRHYYVIEADIDLGDSIVFKVLKKQHYTSLTRVAADEPGYGDFITMLAEIIRYDPVDGYAGESFAGHFKDSQGRNDVMWRSAESPSELPTTLVADCRDNVTFRDFDYDGKNNRFLAVNCDSGNVLSVYSASGPSMASTSLRLRFKRDPGLSSPEGIAVDSDGSIYVADWGNHRVVVFDELGVERGQFGGLGKNGTENVGAPARLVFPSRIAIERDAARIVVGEDTLFRETHILVSDAYGIHKFDSQGHYLDTPVRADESGHWEGVIYGVAIRGYGRTSDIVCVPSAAAAAERHYAPDR